MKLKRLLVLLLAISALTVPCELFAQDITVTGKIVDSKTNQPLSRATVKVKNTNTVAVSDDGGNFTIKAPSSESIITVTFVGYAVYETKAGTGNLSISMTDLGTDLNEVVVVGYGTQRIKDVTGSVVPVNLKRLEDMPTASITEALRGQVPGLNVNGGSTRPGVQANFNIRQQFGWGKDGSSPFPLVVIDDVIQLDPSTGLPSLDQFNLLDISEVESITVLKDATAGIYGARASQGTIVVKTKKGKIGSPKISYSGKFEANDAVSHVKTMSAYEYGIFANRWGHTAGWTQAQMFDATELEALKELNYDWRKEAWKSAGAMQHSINVSGGSERATYFAGGSYYTQSANMGSQDYKKWTFRAGTDVKVVNNVKLSATVSANNFNLEKSFTKVSINDGAYGRGSEQTDYVVLAHMPKYIPWIYNVNGVDRYISPALGPNRVQTTPVGQNNIAGWNYFALLNNGSNTNSGNFAYNTNISLQYDVPFVKGLAVRATYGISQALDNTEQVQLPQTLSVATNTASAGTHLYSPTTTTWFTGENKQGSRVSYSDGIGKITQANLYLNYDRSFGLHNVSAMASIEKGQQDYQKKFVIYDNPLSGGYNGASSSAGTLNTSNSYVQRNEGGTLAYLGRVNYNYDNKYLLQFLVRADASTKFAPENYWGVFPTLSAGWVISRENWFNKKVRWVDNLKIRASIGRTGKDDLQPWRWLQLYSYAADKGFSFGTNGGALGSGLTPDATPNRNVTWDQAIKTNYGIDVSLLKNRLSLSVDQYSDHLSHVLTQMAGMVGVPISVGGAFAEENYSKINTWGTEVMISWRDRIGKDFEYNVGVNFGTGNNNVTRYIPVAFDYPSKNLRQEGMSTIFPVWGFKTWKGTSSGDGMLRTSADIDAYWQYLTDLATAAGGTPSYLGFTTKSGLKRGMLAYEDQAGQLDSKNRTIAGKNGQIEKDQDFVQLAKKNQSYGFNTNVGVSWKGVSLAAQIATSWGGYNSVDFIKNGTSSGQIFWSHEAFLNDMYDSVDNVGGKYPSLFYYDQNSPNSDYWQISTFRCYVRSMSIGYTIPKVLSSKLHMESARLSLSGFNLWDFYNPYPGKYRNMYDNPAIDYPTLRTWALGINVTF
jgi:TonB-linked SusC/RagA family outer membrane protein